MADVGEVRYKVAVDDSGVDKDIKKVEGKLGKIKTSANESLDSIKTSSISSKFSAIGNAAKAAGSVSLSVIKGIGTAFAGLTGTAATAVAAITKTSFENYASYEQLAGGIETLFGTGGKNLEEYAASVGKSVSEVKDEFDTLMTSQQTVMNNADRAYQTAGLSANAYMETVTGFSASLLQSLGGDTEKAAAYADRAIIDMSDNANKMGTSMESIQNAYQGFAKQNYDMLDNLKLGYGGTKEEMQRLIEDASKMTDVQEKLGVTVDSSSLSFDNIVNAISVMQESMGISGTTAEEASSTIEGSVNAVKGAWENLTVAIAAGDWDIGVYLENLVDAVGVAGDNILPRVQTILEGVGEVADGLPPIIADAITVVLEQAPQFANAAISLVSSFLNSIVSSAPQMTTGAVQLVMTLAQGLVDMSPDLMSTATTLIASLVNGLAENLPQIISMAGQLIMSLGSGLIQNLPTLITAAGNLVASLIDTIMHTDWISVGKNIIQGIISGVGAMARALLDAAANIASTFLKGVKDFLGIASPSKVMRDQVGKQIDAGIGVGLEEGMPHIDKGVETVNRRLLGSFSADVDYNLPDLRETAKSLSASISSTSVGGARIEVPVSIDGREVARATAWYMGEQLAWEER